MAAPSELVELLSGFLRGNQGRAKAWSLSSTRRRRCRLRSSNNRALDDRVSTKARLLPLGRDECAAYVAYRLTIAGGGGATVSFSHRAIDVLYGLSGGVPRLVNLLCERALQEAAAADEHTVEPDGIDSAASALELLRARRRRFRWFTKRVS